MFDLILLPRSFTSVPAPSCIKDATPFSGSSSSHPLLSPPSLPLKVQVVFPPHTGTIRSIMPGGAVVTGEGIGANAPRNVWAGVLSVRLVPLLTPTLHVLTIILTPRRLSLPPLVVFSSAMIPVSFPVSKPWRTGYASLENPRVPTPQQYAPSPHPSNPSSSPSCPPARSAVLCSPLRLQISSVDDGPSSSLSASSRLVSPCKPLLLLSLSSLWVVSSPVGASEWFPC